MSPAETVFIFLAGIAAGTINAVVGSGTLVTFPTLVAFGFPPVTATMSNAIGLVPGSISGTWGYRRELKGQWGRLKVQLPASFLGAVIGAYLLLHLPEKAFEFIVPVLLVLALLLVIFQPRIQRNARAKAEAAGRDDSELSPRRRRVLIASTGVAGIYGGYFAAAQGILLVGIMGALVRDTMQRLNAAKNLLSLVVNTVAAATYTLVAFDRIDWAAAGLIAAGSLIGGFVGSAFGRRLPPAVLRAAIVVLGVIAIWRILS